MKQYGVGIIGCGNISDTYLRNAPLFEGVKIVSCADINQEAANARAAQYSVRATSIKGLLASSEVEIVVNLTVPNAHFDVSLAALKAGKHVFTEKPLATSLVKGRKLMEEAGKRGLHLASAPDTFLGAGGRLCRQMIDNGEIGTPIAGTAFFMGHGMEHWHPAPEFFFKPGGGPVFDMGAYYLNALINLLGPVASVRSLTKIGKAERVVSAPGPNVGQRIAVETPTTAFTLIEFAGGATAMLGLSWDVWKHGHRPIEIHGTEGSLRVPDPNFYGGTVEISRRGAEWEAIDTTPEPFGFVNYPWAEPKFANFRVVGIADLARALEDGTPARASGELAVHVLEVLEGMLRSGETGKPVAIASRVERPPAMSTAEAAALLRGK